MNGVTILFVYAVIMILATVILTKKEKNVERFCVGSRSENWLMSALSIAATWIWAPALFVSTEKAYSTGWVKLSAPSRTMHWVDRNKIKPNDYNPNKVSRQNLELLTQSIFTNGWTLPIVVRPDGTIIDGFHRWTVAGPDWKYVPPSEEDDRRTLYERLEGKVLVVIVDHKDKAKNIYGTVTHNRARGTHLLEPMKKIVKELMDEGKTVEEIGKQLGMRPEEIFRLSDFSKEDFLKMMTKGVTGYSKAEFITKI